MYAAATVGLAAHTTWPIDLVPAAQRALEVSEPRILRRDVRVLALWLRWRRELLIESEERILRRLHGGRCVIEKDKRLALTLAGLLQRDEACERLLAPFGQKEVGGRGHHEIGRGDHLGELCWRDAEELDAGRRHFCNVVGEFRPDIQRARAALVRACGLDGARFCGVADGHDDRVRAESKSDCRGHRRILGVGRNDADQPMPWPSSERKAWLRAVGVFSPSRKQSIRTTGAGRTARIAS